MLRDFNFAFATRVLLLGNVSTVGGGEEYEVGEGDFNRRFRGWIQRIKFVVLITSQKGTVVRHVGLKSFPPRVLWLESTRPRYQMYQVIQHSLMFIFTLQQAGNSIWLLNKGLGLTKIKAMCLEMMPNPETPEHIPCHLFKMFRAVLF